MSPKKKSRIPAEKIELYEELVATVSEVERKGADNPYTSINGNMFSLLHSPEGRLALRLPEDELEKFVKIWAQSATRQPPSNVLGKAA